MAYRVQKISPSALAATEHCPRYRPDGKENDAAADGLVLHELAERMVSEPKDKWDAWIALQEASQDTKSMLLAIAEQLRTVVVEDLPVYPGARLRLRGGKPRKTPLKPGLYPECELERGQGRHGYIDLMVVTPEGLVYIEDYKTNRVAHDFSLQLAAYACDVNRLCPAHGSFVCQIIAPRLDEDAQLRMELGPGDLEGWRRRIARIEELADRSANDDSIRGNPCDACSYCHWNGACKYQAQATLAVLETNTTDQVVVSPKTAKATVVQSLATLVGPGGPYEGEAVTAETFRNPATPAQRGLRRACMKFLETSVKAAKEDDATWCGTVPPEALKEAVPGFSIAYVKGRPSVDTTRMSEIREAVMSRFHMSIEDVFEVSAVDTGLLEERLVVDGWTKKKASEEIKKAIEPFTLSGAPSVRWTQLPPKRAALDL